MENSSQIHFKERLTGKAIVFDKHNHIALVGNRINSFYLLPGGGIARGESIEDGIIRECLEEIGYVIKLKEKVGIIEDYRNRDKVHCINHCYTAKVIGEKGDPQLSGDEEKNGMYTIWVPLDNALNIFNREVKQLKMGGVGFYNTGFNILRDSIFLKEVKNYHGEYK